MTLHQNSSGQASRHCAGNPVSIADPVSGNAQKPSVLRRLLGDKGGNFAILFAMLLVPLLGSVGAALDFMYVSNVRGELDAAADAAVVGTISTSFNGLKLAKNMNSNGHITTAEKDAKSVFNSLVSDKLASYNLNLDVEVQKNGLNIEAKLTYYVDVPTTFLRILNIKTVTVSNTVEAKNEFGAYIDFYMLLDNTPSMGVAATTADQAVMESKTSDKCAFACHELQNKNDYYSLAKKNNVTLRIDVVRKATQSLTDTAASTRNFTDQYRMAVYTFGEKAENAGIYKVSDLDSNMANVKTLTNSVDLMTIPYQGYNNDQQTSLDDALKRLNSDITSVGDGSGSNSRMKAVFLVSDGVGDSYKPSSCTKKTTGGRCQEPIDASYCKALKDRGIMIAVLYTTYLPLPANGWYNSWIKPFQSEIGVKMKECASQDLYFEVGMNQGISEAMDALFRKVTNQPRLTN